MTRPDEDEEYIDEFADVDPETQAKLILKGQDAQASAIRQAIGDERFETLREEINEAAKDPLYGKSRESWSRKDWGQAWADGSVRWAEIPDKVKEEMDLR